MLALLQKLNNLRNMEKNQRLLNGPFGQHCSKAGHYHTDKQLSDIFDNFKELLFM